MMNKLRHKFIERPTTEISSVSFPEDFYDFNNGVDVSNERINEWIEDSLDYFRKNPNEPYWRHSIASGNTMVIVFKWYNDGEPYYEVIVTKGYYEKAIFPEEN